jgi:hypothetical protein
METTPLLTLRILGREELRSVLDLLSHSVGESTIRDVTAETRASCFESEQRREAPVGKGELQTNTV